MGFIPYDTHTKMLEATGLHAVAVYDDWNRTPFDAVSSDEMIFCLGH